jgi:hypothetical protein
VGGSATQLSFDVKTHAVSGTVTMNGAIPSATCNSADRGTVHFVDSAQNYSFAIGIPCNGRTTPFTFSGHVYPGTYRVSVSGSTYSDLPSQKYLVASALTINADKSNLGFNLETHAVSGTVTMNGAIPSATCNSADRGTVHFVDSAQNYSFAIGIPCNGRTTPFTFSGHVYPGTYRVSVSGSSYSDLPSQKYLVASALTITSDKSNLSFDLKTHAVSGTVTMNGAIPSATCNSADRGTVHFVDSAQNYSFAIGIPCNGRTTPFTFSGHVYPGTYRVSVSGSSYSDLPSQQYFVANALTINSDKNNLSFDLETHAVSGTITMNGAIPTATCNSADRGTVHFVDSAQNYSFAIGIPCNGRTTPFTFSGHVYPGIYRVSVSGTAYSDLSSQKYVLVDQLQVP